MDKAYWRGYYRRNARNRKLTLGDYHRANQARPDVVAMGRRLKDLREAAGLSQLEFGRKLGCTQGTISSWELGKIPVNVERIAAVEPDLAEEIRRAGNGETVIHT